MRQRAPDNHVLDLVVVCTLSPLRMSSSCTASEWTALSLPGCVHPPTHASFESAALSLSHQQQQMYRPDLRASDPVIVVWFLMGHMLHLGICFRSKGMMSPGGEGNKLHCCPALQCPRVGCWTAHVCGKGEVCVHGAYLGSLRVGRCVHERARTRARGVDLNATRRMCP